MESPRTAFKDLAGTLTLVGVVLLASVILVVVELAIRSTGPAGDVTVKETNFKIVMPTTLRAGRHTFALTNGGTVPHELLLFRTNLADNALPVGADGNVIEDSPALHKVVDSGNGTAPGGSASVPSSEALVPGHYVAVCNLPGHYRLGMRLNVTVIP